MDRNFHQARNVVDAPMSLSARRAWIEISPYRSILNHLLVALRKESVDRNILYPDSAPTNWAVALRKESVDRNCSCWCWGYRLRCVALRKESVDRNGNGDVVNGIASGSLSARRAWIEITLSLVVCMRAIESLSARRAWIEICTVSMPPW